MGPAGGRGTTGTAPGLPGGPPPRTPAATDPASAARSRGPHPALAHGLTRGAPRARTGRSRLGSSATSPAGRRRRGRVGGRRGRRGVSPGAADGLRCARGRQGPCRTTTGRVSRAGRGAARGGCRWGVLGGRRRGRQGRREGRPRDSGDVSRSRTDPSPRGPSAADAETGSWTGPMVTGESSPPRRPAWRPRRSSRALSGTHGPSAGEARPGTRTSTAAPAGSQVAIDGKGPGLPSP